MRMFAHQRLGARALPRGNRLDDRVVLHMGVVQTPVFRGKVIAVDGQRLDRGERQMVVARQCLTDRRIARRVDDRRMETDIHLKIGRRIRLLEPEFSEHRIAGFQELFDYIRTQIDAHLDAPRDDLTTFLIETHRDETGDPQMDWLRVAGSIGLLLIGLTATLTPPDSSPRSR